jgi:hypothetical protein
MVLRPGVLQFFGQFLDGRLIAPSLPSPFSGLRRSLPGSYQKRSDAC